MSGTKEILIALPEHGDDIYRRHQLVWRAMHGNVTSGRGFIFQAVGAHLARVRSDTLERGMATQAREGWLTVTLVASARIPSVATPLKDDDLPGYLDQLMTGHGYELLSCQFTDSWPARGRKRDRETGRVHAIELPTREITMNVRITHPAKAELAWQYGIGRGKRFGFGMLSAEAC